MFAKLLHRRFAGYVVGILGIAAVTWICDALRSHLNEMTVALAMLLVVLFVACVWERWPALVVSVIGVVCLNYYFLPPIYSFTIEDPKNWIALAAFFVTALTAGRLSAWAKQEAAVAAASRSQARLASAYNRSLLEASLDPLLTIGRDGKINDVNTAAETITGYSRADLIGTHFSEHFTERAKARAAYEEVLHGDLVRGYALELRHRSGHSTSVLYDGSLYRDADGQVIGAVAAIRPISTYTEKPFSAPPDPRVVRHLGLFVRCASIFSVLVGLASVAGLEFGISVLKSFLPGQPVIKMNTAVCLALLGCCLWIARKPAIQPGLKVLCGQIMAGIVALIGLLSLVEHWFNWDLRIDQLLFREPAADAFFSARPGLMAPITALDFLFLGLAFLLLDRPVVWRARSYWPSNYLASFTALLALLGVLDNILGAHTSFTHVAVQSAVTLLVISLGVLFTRIDSGVAALLASSTEGGAIMRRLVPAAILIPILIGAVSWKALSAGRYSQWGAISIMMITMMALLTALAIWNGYISNRGDVERRRAEAALHHSEMELREAQRLAKSGSWWWDVKTDKVTLSAGLSHLLRRNPMLPPPTYREHLAFYTPASSSRLDAAVQNAIQTGASFEIELDLNPTNGSARAVTARGEVERDAENVVVLVRGTVEDITERKQADEALRRSAEEIHDLYNHAPCGYHSVDRDGIIVRINDTELEWLGRTREEVIGKRFTDFITPEGLKTFEKSLAQVKATGAAQDLEYELVRKDGTTFPVLLSATTIKSLDGQFLMTRSTVYDITERKRAEQARAHLAAIVEYSDDAIISKTLDQKILTWNKGAERMFGYTAQEMLGRPISVLAPPDRLEELQNIMAKLRRGESTERLETVRVTKDKRAIDASITISPIRDANGDIVGAATIERDITSRKRAENEIRRLASLQGAVAEIGEKALRSHQPTELFDEAVALTAKTLQVEYCKVLELLPDGNSLLLRAGVGWKEGLVGHATVGTGLDSQAGFTLRSHEPVVVENLCTEKRFSGPPLLHDHGVVSGMSVIISTSAGPYGVLGAHTRQKRAFSKDEVNFLQSVANVLGTMIERHRAEQALLRSNRQNRALSLCNQALIRATDESALLNEICRIIVDQAGYRFCWVGRAEQDGAKAVRPIAQAGFEEDYLKNVNATWDDTARGRGPTGTCIRTGEKQLVKNFATDPRLLPWRSEALKRGYASSLAIPLLVDSKTFGALTIYSGETQAFGAEEVDLLSELAADLGFGLTTLHTRAELQRADNEIRALNTGLEQRVIERTAQLEEAYTELEAANDGLKQANQELEQAHEREIEFGFKIQDTLLLDHPPKDVPGLCVAALSIPSQRIDGDFYTFIRHSPDCLDVIVGDVMGKGHSAALLGAATKSHFQRALIDLMSFSKADDLREPKEITSLSRAGNLPEPQEITSLSGAGNLPEPKEIVMLAHAGLAARLIDLDSFVTLCYARLNMRQHTLTLVDCGHTGVIHRHGKTGQCELLHGENLPLGVRQGEIYDQFSVPLETGDLLFFYSDGITEARNPSGQLFGEARLEKYVRANGEVDPELFVQGIRKDVSAFSKVDRLADDLTSVAVRVEDTQLPVAYAEIRVLSDLGRLRQTREFVRTFCSNLPGVPFEAGEVCALELAVNEAISNIMKHAYHGRSDQWIHLEAEAFSSHLAIQLHHFGDPFDPSVVPPPPFDGSRESGFGAYIITKSVDEVRYYRDERGRNCVELIKFRKPHLNRTSLNQKGNVA